MNLTLAEVFELSERNRLDRELNEHEIAKIERVVRVAELLATHAAKQAQP